ncbi:hypothetical protein AALT_g11256 [Alternaria alternata]|nr:hypothetical protein AALT_g11256 [Alternaria alternata]
MTGDPKFIILKYQAWMKTAAFEDTILGAITKQPLSPSTNYVPDAPAAYISHALQEGSATDFVLEGTGSKSQGVAGSLTSIGQFSVSGSREASVHLNGKHIRYKRIQQLDQFWAKLREDPNVKRSMGDWISKWNDWPVCLVVGIMICEDVEISMDAAKTQERKVQGEIPVNEILLPSGGVNPLGKDANPKLEATSSQHTATLFKANMGESSIFAVELKIVTTGWLHRKLLKLKDKGPNVGDNRLAGMDSDEDSDDEESVDGDLILTELDADTVKDMAQD